ncbi:hypothetical protein NQZ68_003159 [Dissostichus eleginoides]|nr:hypothetical protein NQZ68_003159 [Dissostichus eleginoides]
MASLSAFVDAPSVSLLDDCKKAQLVEIAEHYKIAIVGSNQKDEIKAVIVSSLFEQGVLQKSESGAAGVVPVVVQTAGLTFEQQKVLLAMQFEQKKLQLELRLEQEKLRLEQEKLQFEQEKLRLEQEKLEQEKLQLRLEQEKLQLRLEQEKLRLEQEELRLEKLRLEQEKLEQEKLELRLRQQEGASKRKDEIKAVIVSSLFEQGVLQKSESGAAGVMPVVVQTAGLTFERQKVLLAMQFEQEKLQLRLEQEKLELRLEQEELRLEKLEQEELRLEKLEQEELRLEKLEKLQLRLEQEKLRLEQEKLEKLRLEQERLEQEKLRLEKLQLELRLEQEVEKRLEVLEVEKMKCEEALVFDIASGFVCRVVATWLVSAVFGQLSRGACPRDFVVLPACRSLHNSAGFQCVITRRKPHDD